MEFLEADGAVVELVRLGVALDMTSQGAADGWGVANNGIHNVFVLGSRWSHLLQGNVFKLYEQNWAKKFFKRKKQTYV